MHLRHHTDDKLLQLDILKNNMTCGWSISMGTVIELMMNSNCTHVVRLVETGILW